MESFDLGPCTVCVGKVSDQALGILFSTRLPSDFRVVRKNNTQVLPWRAFSFLASRVDVSAPLPSLLDKANAVRIVEHSER